MDLKSIKHAHFIGIGGIGLSALAQFLSAQKIKVSGSDALEGSMTKFLRNKGLKINVPHAEDSVLGADVIIHSAVIKQDNKELVRARKIGISCLCRADALPMILASKKVFSVCGAHGKSTTSAMLASILPQSSALIGAVCKEFSSNARSKSGEMVVFEADESDKSFLNSNPFCAIVTNAEPEHMETYNHDLAEFYGAYRQFLESATFRVINDEDEFLSTLKFADEIESEKSPKSAKSGKTIRLNPKKDISEIYFVLRENEPYTRFNLKYAGKNFGNFEVAGIGAHIAVDAALAILAAHFAAGVKIPTIRENLANYRGIKKRFDILYVKDTTPASSELSADSSAGIGLDDLVNFGGLAEAPKDIDPCVIIDDYAHHPTEIAASLQSIKKYRDLGDFGKISAIWQPHKYSRLCDYLDEFVKCFAGVDRLVILPVYNVGESPRDVDLPKLFEKYKPIFADRIRRVDDGVILIKKGARVGHLNNGIIVGFNAGDLTYQLRGEQ